MPGSTTVGPQASLWGLRAWRLAFPAALVSRAGDAIFDLTVVLWISLEFGVGESWAPAAVGGVLAAAVVPVLVVGPLAGLAVDRVGRRGMLITSNLVQAVATASLVIPVALAQHLPLWIVLAWLYSVVFVTNSAGQFFVQARTVMISKTIPANQLTPAFAAQGAANSALGILAPPLAAPLYFLLGFTGALVVNALSFAVSTLLLALVAWDGRPESAAAGQGWRAAIRQGIGAVVGDRLLLSLVLVITMVTLATSAITNLEVFFVVDVLRQDAALLSVVLSAFAGGVLVGSLLAPRLDRSYSTPGLLVCGVLVMGVLVIIFSRMTEFVPAVVILALAAVPLGVINSILIPYIIRTVEPEILGRSMIALNTLPTVAALVGIAGASWLVSSALIGFDVTLGGLQFGPVDTVFTAAGALIVLTGAVTAPIIIRMARRAPR